MSWEKEFDEKFGVMPEEDGGWTYPPSPTAIKEFITGIVNDYEEKIRDWTLEAKEEYPD